MRPEMPTIVYTRILKELYPDVPVVLGGIEASLRRLSHYDYWQERLRPGILKESGADVLVYGMGELPMAELCRNIEEYIMRDSVEDFLTVDALHRMLEVHPVPQTVVYVDRHKISRGISEEDIILHSYEEALKSPKAQASNFKHIEEESNRLTPQRILQQTGDKYMVVNPPYPPMTTEQIDRSFDFPYTRLPHPKYKDKRIPAYEMIKFSVNIHRGCFGGCSFCTISAHQGKFISSRSKQSILREVEAITRMPDFKGHLSDLGGPSANMYAMRGKNMELCRKCRRPSCVHPQICKNMSNDYRSLLDIYKTVRTMPGVKRVTIGSGVRYDLLLHRTGDENVDKATDEYTRELILHHVSGRLKVAPEHTSSQVLHLMRKPPFEQFERFKQVFDRINQLAGLRQQIIPYFISSHPGSTPEDMAELAVLTKKLDFHLEQVQDFTPTPMTVSTEAWHTGLHPYTLKPVFSAKSATDKLKQRMFFFWYKPEERQKIIAELRRINRSDLIDKLFGNTYTSRPIKGGSQTNKTSTRKR